MRSPCLAAALGGPRRYFRGHAVALVVVNCAAVLQTLGMSYQQMPPDRLLASAPDWLQLVPRLQARGASTMRATRACLLLLAALALATEAGVRAQDS